MSRLARLVLVVVVAVAAGLVLPGAYSAADEAPAGSGSASPGATPSPTPSPEQTTPSPAPSATPPEAEPTPTVTSPPASPTPTVSAEPTPQAGLGQSDIGFSMSASPTSIFAGEETTITAHVTNSADEPAEDLDVVVILPVELEYVSAAPAPSSVQPRGGKTALVFSSLVVPGQSSLELSITGEGIDDTDAALVEGSALWQGNEFPASTTVAIEVPPSDLTVDTKGPGVLTEVGTQVRYFITVRNEGDAAVQAVSIVNLVPREVHVVAVGVAPGIDGVQVGQAGNGAEDVVWALDEFAAGETIKVSYTGVVDDPGDLKAVNETRLVTGPADAGRTTETTYLAASEGRGSTNPGFEPVIEKRVTRERVTERTLVRRRSATEPSALDSSALPYSGVDPWGVSAIGATLIALGFILWRLSARRGQTRNLVAGALLLLLVAAACVSNDSEDSLQGEGNQVKGREIIRGEDDPPQDDADVTETEPDQDGSPDSEGDGEGSDDEGGGGVEDADDPDDPDAPDDADDPDAPDDADDPDAPDDADDPDAPDDVFVLGPPVTRIERRTTLVTITEGDLPVVDADSVTDARPTTFAWDDSATSVTDATSSTSLGEEGGLELTAEISPAGAGMRARVTLRNLAFQKRLAVSGRLSLALSGGGASATLHGGDTDVVLNPGGESTASFTFRLPSGSYTARPIFTAR